MTYFEKYLIMLRMAYLIHGAICHIQGAYNKTSSSDTFTLLTSVNISSLSFLIHLQVFLFIFDFVYKCTYVIIDVGFSFE